VNQSRHACLVDFGLSTIVSVETHLDSALLVASQRDSLMSFIYGGSYPWMSPELLDPGDTCEHGPTKQSDVYALGMLIYEVRGHGLAFGAATATGNSKEKENRCCAGELPFAISRIRQRLWGRLQKGHVPRNRRTLPVLELRMGCGGFSNGVGRPTRTHDRHSKLFFLACVKPR